MMSGSFREYNWKDILRLVMQDAGLKTEEDQRKRGETWLTNFQPPKYDTYTCITVHVYDKKWEDRIKSHVEGK